MSSLIQRKKGKIPSEKKYSVIKAELKILEIKSEFEKVKATYHLELERQVKSMT